MKSTDWIAEYLKRHVDYVFGVQGGAVVHLFDSCVRMGPTPIFCHHEQAAAFAAVAYAKTNGFGVCIVTTGPGATNAITPLLGAFQDSTAVLFISGQVRSSQMSYGKPVRQVGTQEAPICDIVRPICKAAMTITDIEDLRMTLIGAQLLSVNQRPGPVWVEIPQDLQWKTL